MLSEVKLETTTLLSEFMLRSGDPVVDFLTLVVNYF